MSAVSFRTVDKDEAGMRLDRWFRQHYPGLGHGGLEKLLRKGDIRVDGGRAKSNRRLEPGETVRIPPLPEGRQTNRRRDEPAKPEDARALRAMILYEDDAIVAINKPFGLASQGGVKTSRHLDGLLSALRDSETRPRLTHRLDKDTGGLILVAKTRRAAQSLTEAFRHRRVEKTYWALVVGAPHPRKGRIDLPLAKELGGARERMVAGPSDAAKKAITDYQTVESVSAVSFLAMRPETGRTHQLRAHAAAIGAPIVGDGKYGGETARIDGVPAKLHLFCRQMTFEHPETGRDLTLKAPLTGHMAETWRFFSFDQDAECVWPENI